MGVAQAEFIQEADSVEISQNGDDNIDTSRVFYFKHQNGELKSGTILDMAGCSFLGNAALKDRMMMAELYDMGLDILKEEQVEKKETEEPEVDVQTEGTTDKSEAMTEASADTKVAGKNEHTNSDIQAEIKDSKESRSLIEPVPLPESSAATVSEKVPSAVTIKEGADEKSEAGGYSAPSAPTELPETTVTKLSSESQVIEPSVKAAQDYRAEAVQVAEIAKDPIPTSKVSRITEAKSEEALHIPTGSLYDKVNLPEVENRFDSNIPDKAESPAPKPEFVAFTAPVILDAKTSLGLVEPVEINVLGIDQEAESEILETDTDDVEDLAAYRLLGSGNFIEAAEETEEVEVEVTEEDHIASLDESSASSNDLDRAIIASAEGIEDIYLTFSNERPLLTQPEAEHNITELSDELSVSVEEVEYTVHQIAEQIEALEPEEAEATHKILDEIMQLPLKLEVKVHPENVVSKEEVQAEIEELFTELFDRLGIEYTPELLETFVNLTLNHSFEELIDKNVLGEETENVPQENGTHEFLQKILQGITRIKRAIQHAYLVGRSAMRLYTFQPA